MTTYRIRPTPALASRGLVSGLALAASLAAPLACLAGCNNRPVTEVVVVVRTTYAVPTALDGVRIEARRQGGTIQMSEGAWTMASEPKVLGLVHDGGPLGPIEVSVVGMLGPDEIVTRDATFTFVEGEIRRVELWLVPECATGLSPCRGSDTCDPGAVCRSTEVAPGELLPWTGAVTPDAGVSPDTGGLDGGTSNDAGMSTPDAALPCCSGSLPHVTEATCNEGRCVIVTCDTDWGDCSAADPGCETRLVTRNDCGRCSRDCSGSERCVDTGDGYQCQ